MRGSLPQELTFTTVLTSLLSLVLILRLLYPKSSLWKLSNYCFWKWTSHDFFSWNWTWHDFFSWNWSLIFVFTCLLIATSTLFGIWGKKSHRVFEVLSQLSWLNGLSVQVCTNPFGNITTNQELREWLYSAYVMSHARLIRAYLYIVYSFLCSLVSLSHFKSWAL
jgi:hypothetical protein